METKIYIENLKKKTVEPLPVALRQALIHYLRGKDVPVTIIQRILGCTRRNIYYSYYKARDLFEAGDKMIIDAQKETLSHSITIVPCTIAQDGISLCVGYKLIIDNKTF